MTDILPSKPICGSCGDAEMVWRPCDLCDGAGAVPQHEHAGSLGGKPDVICPTCLGTRGVLACAVDCRNLYTPPAA